MKKSVLILLFIVCLLILPGCKKYKSDMDGIKSLVEQEIYNQKSDKYYVFFYRENCSGCEATKPYILEYIKLIKKSEYKDCRKIYGVNLSNPKNVSMYVKNNKENGQGRDGAFWVNGVSNWEELRIGSTPSVISVYEKDGVKVSNYVAQGRDNIVDALDNELNSKKGK